MASHGLAGEGLSRRERLRHRRDFERVFREGRRLRLPYLKIVLVENELGIRRLGLSVPRRFGKAVRRNRAKRILREIFRRQKALFPASHDIVFIPGAGFLERSMREVVEDLRALFRGGLPPGR